MGTNYYAIKKKNFEKQRQIDDILCKIANLNLEKDILNLIDKKYKNVINILNNTQKKEYYYKLEYAIDTFLNSIRYDVNDVFHITENTKIHIGKSSIGWLFNFQEQNKEECKWHNYEEVFNWLERNTTGYKALYKIVDEYNRPISFEEFKDLVDTKQKDPRNLSNPDNFTYSKNVNGYRFNETNFS